MQNNQKLNTHLAILKSLYQDVLIPYTCTKTATNIAQLTTTCSTFAHFTKVYLLLCYQHAKLVPALQNTLKLS